MTSEDWEKYRRSYTLLFDLSGFDKAEEYYDGDDEDDHEEDDVEDESDKEDDYPRIDLDVCSACELRVREALNGIMKKLTPKKIRH